MRAELAKVHDMVLPDRPGMFARDDAWWDHRLFDPPHRREGWTPLRCVLAEDASGPRGYGLYAARSTWDDHFLAAGTLQVREMMAADPAAAASIWRDLLTRDLVTEVQVPNRPLDDPLLHLLADPRRARARVADGLWVRLTDVGRALTQRRYAAETDVVIEVSDETCPPNSGRWRLRTHRGGDGAGFAAACERTGDPADLGASVRALGAAYLGGTLLGSMAGAGFVTELRRGAIAELSAAMSWDPAPWCPMIF
jgi:predicted acetyltransferase